MSISIAIDGPAGAGKSTIARMLAQKLGFIYVDTGAMYRAMGVFFSDNGLTESDRDAMGGICENAHIEIVYENGEQQVLLNGQNVNDRIRTEQAGLMASACATNQDVRRQLVHLQQELAKKMNVVMDGRDIGTCVLPDADLKIYLTASVQTRAKRRYDELVKKQADVSFSRVEADIIARDAQDMNREFSPLRQAEDAVLLDSSDMTVEQVLAKMEEMVERL